MNHADMLLEAIQSMYHNVIILDILCKEKSVHTNTKAIFRTIINRENANIRDIALRLSKEQLDVFNAAVNNYENVLAFANVRHLFYSLEKEQQDEVEAFISGIVEKNISKKK